MDLNVLKELQKQAKELEDNTKNLSDSDRKDEAIRLYNEIRQILESENIEDQEIELN